MSRTKLTAQTIREIEQNPTGKKVVAELRRWMGSRRSGMYYEAGSTIHMGEGEDIRLWNKDGDQMTINMVSSDTIGMARQHGGVNYRIGDEITVPVGCWGLVTCIFLGQKFAYIYHNNGQHKIAS